MNVLQSCQRNSANKISCLFIKKHVCSCKVCGLFADTHTTADLKCYILQTLLVSSFVSCIWMHFSHRASPMCRTAATDWVLHASKDVIKWNVYCGTFPGLSYPPCWSGMKIHNGDSKIITDFKGVWCAAAQQIKQSVFTVWSNNWCCVN